MKKKTIAALLTVVLATPFAPSAMAATPGDTLVIATRIDDIITLDPAEVFEFSGTDLVNNVYDTLVQYDPGDLAAGYKPGLAESWSVSPDGRTFTFKIRGGVRFHSGNPVTARDAEFSLRRAVILNKTPAFILTQFGFTPENVEERIRATDDRTLVITTDNPYAESLVLNCMASASSTPIVDRDEVLKHEKDGDMGHDWLRTNSAGSGAYKVRNWKPGESYTLDANPDHWQGAPSLRRVIVRHVQESSVQRLLLEKGDVDVARNLTPEDIAAVAGNSDLAVDEVLRGRVLYMGLNQEVEPLRHPKVIEAVKILVDYDGMARSFLKGQWTPHQAFLPLSFMGELKEKPFSLDIERAKALLSEAGYPNGFDVKIFVRTDKHRTDTAQAVQSAFAKAGINAELITGTGKQILTEYRARKHEIYLGEWGPDYGDPHTNADTFSHNPDNAFEAKNTGKLAWRNAWDIPEMSRQTEAAARENDTAKRAEMYRAIQRDHQRRSPFVIMFQKTEQTGRRKNVKGFIAGSAVARAYYWTARK